MATGVGAIFFASANGVYSTITPVHSYGTITKGSSSAMNHIEVDVTQTRIEVWGTDAGASLKHLAGADLNLTFTQGLVWLNDVHYNARKAIEPCECGTQFDHSFAWDNLGFDGPKTYRDWGYDVPYANSATAGRTSQHGDVEVRARGLRDRQRTTNADRHGSQQGCCHRSEGGPERLLVLWHVDLGER